MITQFTEPCPVCRSTEFIHNDILWQDLKSSWQLSDYEAAYTNRQQGFHCKNCSKSLRAMGLARAILRAQNFAGSLHEFCITQPELALLEINTAGCLTPFLKQMPMHKLVEYPNCDMLNLDIADEIFDLVIHSDTLEHVSDPVRGLSECRRVLRANGICIFTIPIIVDRVTRSRNGLPPSYHGQVNVDPSDQRVCTEFGVDAWKFVIKAGFSSCEIFRLNTQQPL